MNSPLEIVLRTLYVGTCRRVTALELDGKCFALEFLKNISRSNPAALSSINARLRAVADVEKYRNDQTFKPLGEGLYEFKFHKTSLRLYAFYDEVEGLEPQLIIATNGGKKNAKKGQDRDISKARKLMREYLDAKEAPSTLPIIKEPNDT